MWINRYESSTSAGATTIRPAACGNGGRFTFLHAPAFVSQHTANRRLTRHVADQFDGCGIKTRLYRYGLILLRVHNRLQLHVMVECLPASLVDGANSGSKLSVGIGGDVLRQEIDKPPIALQQRKHLNRAIE